MGFKDRPGFITSIGAGNDKVLTVPTNEEWELVGVYCDFTTDATVGVRQLELQVRDDADVILFRQVFSETQAASISNKRYASAQRLVPEIHVAGEMIFEQLPRVILLGGYDVRVVDTAGISASDTLNVRVNRVSSNVV